MQPESVWAMPPPFATNNYKAPKNSNSGLIRVMSKSALRNRDSTRSSAGLRVRYSNGGLVSKMPYMPSPMRKQSDDEDDDFDEVEVADYDYGEIMPPRSVKAKMPWMPATKHPHRLTGCAPNGMRLFEQPSSKTLSKQAKRARDQILVSNLTKIKQEIAAFESDTSSSLDAGRSLLQLGMEHGKLVQDMRIMQKETEERCKSRWEPGLGRRHRQSYGATVGARSLRGI